MHSVHSTAAIRGSSALNILFNACRANESRGKVVIDGYSVEFIPLAGGEHRAVVRESDGCFVASAIVDEMDC